MTNDYIQLRARIMRRVYFAYMFRKARQPAALQLGSLLVLAVISSFLISIKNIFTNVSSIHTAKGFVRFFTDAFVHTQVIVQVIAVAGILVALAFIANVAWKVTSTVTHRFG
jgi:hypothetical protein